MASAAPAVRIVAYWSLGEVVGVAQRLLSRLVSRELSSGMSSNAADS